MGIGPQLALFVALAAAPPEEVRVEADRLLGTGTPRRVVGTGNAKLFAQGLSVRADEVSYVDETGVAEARGNVVFTITTGALFAGHAQRLQVRFLNNLPVEVHLEEGWVLQKRRVSAERLAQVETRAAAEKTGQTEVSLRARTLRRLTAEHWAIDGLAFTPCDCDPNHPSWTLRAPYGSIDWGDRNATLAFPSVFVGEVPVFWLPFPWVPIPLDNRRSGVLIPKPKLFDPNSGFVPEWPIFLTLGPSYDLTFTPGYFFGTTATEEERENGLPADGLRGVRGPRIHTEFRYAPTPTLSGRATLGVLHDFKLQRNPLNGQETVPNAGPRGLRGEASWQHQHDLGGGWGTRVDASAVSDGYYTRDLTADILARETEYLRSTAVAFHRLPDQLLWADLALLQDLRSGGFNVFGRPEQDREGRRVWGPNTLQRLPALSWAVPTRPLVGPVWASFRTGYVRYGPWHGLSEDEGLEDGSGRRDRVFQPGEREARDRVDAQLTLSAPFRPWRGPVGVTPYVAGRALSAVTEVTGQTALHGHVWGGVRVDTDVRRTFANGWRHVVTPAIELRAGSQSWGSTLYDYDALDWAAPRSPGFLQGVVAVRQRLLWPTRTGALSELLRLDLGQGFSRREPVDAAVSTREPAPVAETFGRLQARGGPLTLAMLGRYDPVAQRLTQLSTQLTVTSGGGPFLSAMYDGVGQAGTTEMHRPLDALVGPSPSAPSEYFDQISVMAGTPLPGKFGLTYNALVQKGAGTEQEPSRFALRQHSVGVSYAPACQCWRVEVSAVQRPTVETPWPVPEVGFNLTVSGFGSLGVSR